MSSASATAVAGGDSSSLDSFASASTTGGDSIMTAGNSVSSAAASLGPQGVTANATYASVAHQDRSVSRGRRGKRSNSTQGQDGQGGKRSKQNHPDKIEVWLRKDGKKAPIDLAAWKQMDTLLCIAAVDKVRKSGPPKGGIGMKNWLQHTHPGSDKATRLHPSRRLGHAIIRFSTLDAQEWYRPLVEEALGTDEEGELMQLSLDAESDDARARYSGSVLRYEFTTLGDTDEQRNSLLLKLILSAIDEPYEERDSEISRGRILSTDGKEDLWRFLSLTETALDNILLNQRYGILPTAVCPVRLLKQKRAETPEEKLIEATSQMKVQPGRGKSPRERNKYSSTADEGRHIHGDPIGIRSYTHFTCPSYDELTTSRGDLISCPCYPALTPSRRQHLPATTFPCRPHRLSRAPTTAPPPPRCPQHATRCRPTDSGAHLRWTVRTNNPKSECKYG